jgi:hypothetical protein
MITRSFGFNAAATMPTAPYPQPMSKMHPVFGKIIDSISNLVPKSIRLFEKTLDAVKNSKFLRQRLVRIKPNLSLDFGSAAK